MQYKYKKKLYKILFIVILLGFIISLVGCNWLSLGLLNVFDPQAQIRVNYTGMDLEVGTIALEVYSLNEVEFIGSGFKYEYYVDSTKITSLTKTVGATFYVAPSTSPGTPGPTTTIDLLLYYQEVQDYITSNPLVIELTCTISLLGTDGAGHSISKSVTVDLPAIEPGIDFVPPTAIIIVTPGTTGTEPFTVIFDGSESCDKRNEDSECKKSGIASYSWDFGDGTSAAGVMPAAHTYTSSGSYIVKLTVTDFWGNEGYATIVITVTEVVVIVPGIGKITVSANPQSNVPGGASIISAIVTDTEGDVVANGTTVYFYTNSGTLSAGSANTTNGIATVTLTLAANMQVGEKAKVTAFIGTVNGFVEVTCTEVVVPGVGNITVSADPQSNVAGGDSDITAIVTNTEGDFVDDGTTVYFYTNSGNLSADSANTTNGIATVTLTLAADMQDGDIATVTAFIGAVNGSVEVTCTVALEVGAKIDTTPSPATGFIPFTVGFDASRSTVASLPIVSYEWEFNDLLATTDTGKYVVFTFSGEGTYLVKLTVTDSADPANVYVAFVTVIAEP